jgi:predicted ATPase
MAKSVRDPVLLSWAYCLLGEVLFYKGELVSAREHVEQGIAFYDPQLHHSRVSFYGQDPKVGCLYWAALTLWLLGYPDQALKRSYEAITLAQELSRPFSLAGALNFTATVHQFRREGKAAQEQAEAAIALSTEHGIPQWLMVGMIVRGRALAEQGQVEEGIALMCQGLTAQRASGVEMSRPYFLVELTEAYAKGGQVEEGLNVAAEALTVVDRTGDHVAEAELYRLKGELTLQQEARGWRPETSPQASRAVEQEAKGYFLKAIEIARRQQAKSWELRAVMGLARLWQQQGKKEEARQMLAEIYGWFTEGFETADLRAAQALLKELG